MMAAAVATVAAAVATVTAVVAAVTCVVATMAGRVTAMSCVVATMASRVAAVYWGAVYRSVVHWQHRLVMTHSAVVVLCSDDCKQQDKEENKEYCTHL